MGIFILMFYYGINKPLPLRPSLIPKCPTVYLIGRQLRSKKKNLEGNLMSIIKFKPMIKGIYNWADDGFTLMVLLMPSLIFLGV